MTVPSGGTSDYAPEMIHAAAKGEPYACFVRPDTRIPFMAMPDGVDALMTFAAAPRERLTRTTYNVAAFNPSAEEIRDVVLRAFPRARIDWDVDQKRQGIVDSWPADVDDSAARRDWGFAPRYDFERAFRTTWSRPSASVIEKSQGSGPLQPRALEGEVFRSTPAAV